MNRPKKRRQKSGRNEPCACGSSKKYKQCCLRSNEKQAKVPSNEEISLSQTLPIGILHHQAGRLQQADALHLSGVTAYQKGELDIAVELINKAISAYPSAANYYSNLGDVLQAQDKLNAAIVNYQKALLIKPNYIEALNNLGVAFKSQGKLDAAVECYRKALAIMPNYIEALNNLGVAFKSQDKLDAAVECYRKALAIMPNYFDAHMNIGAALRDLGQLDVAIEHFRKANCIKPNSAEALNNIGVVLKDQGKLDASVECYQKALLIKPNYTEALNNLGVAFKSQGKLDEAVECYRKVLAIMTNYIEAHYNLGVAYKNQGRLDAAAECNRKALLIKPDYADTSLNLGYLLMEQGKQQQALALYEKGLVLNPSCAPLHHSLIFAASRMFADDGAKVFELSKKFGKQFEVSRGHLSHRNDVNPDRCIRVGYVSGDFFRHSVACFIEPILASHDNRNIETFCYYNHHQVDHCTRKLMEYADHWRSILGVSDEDAAKLIRQDAIDILVDLSGHTAHNRLLLFARKPAPVQVTWFGYPVTTGLSAIDYRLTNRYVNPPGWNEQYHTERLVRLSTSTCFQPEKALPEINALPALKNGYLTFASFHAPNKITPITISRWAKLLSALPNARLVLCPDTSKDQITRQFQALGIASDRLDFFGKRPMQQYLALHNEVDIMLDTFPYNGGTISRHSLWMGIPVLTLAGRQAVSRVGLALMTQVGLTSFVAECEADFVDNACRWAGDLDGLAQVRNTLREKMQDAPFSKPALVVKELEAAYRQMWCNWCEQQKTES